MSLNICACGCGLPVRWKGAKYRRGHNLVTDSSGWKPKQYNLCACGCGQTVKTPGRKVCRGHFTPEMRAAISADKRANNPMKRKEVSSKVKETWRENGQAEIASERMKAARASGKFMPSGVNTPEQRQRTSERMKRNNPMKRPEVASRVQATLERNGKQGASLRAFWDDPERSADARAKTVERMRANNPMAQIDIREKSLSKTRQHLEPSKLEEWFGRFCLRHNFPVWYTGTGEFWVHGRNPDFKIHDSRLLIEVTDGYSRKPQRRTLENYALPTIAHYEAHGWMCLVVMLPPRRQSRTLELQASLAQAMTAFMQTQQSAVWSFQPSQK